MLRVLLEQRESSRTASPSFKRMKSQSNDPSRGFHQKQRLTLVKFGKDWYDLAKKRCSMSWKAKLEGRQVVNGNLYRGTTSNQPSTY